MTAIRPLLSSLTRHKGAVAVIVMEIALTCAILCNAFDLISRRVRDIQTVSGIDEAHIARILTSPLGPESERWARTNADLDVIRSVPGVADVTILNQLPLTSNSSNSSFSTTPQGATITAGITMADPGVFSTLGLKIVQGRAFANDEYIKVSEATDDTRFTKAVITKAMADKLFPGQNAVGKALYMGEDTPIQIIGVVERLVRPGKGWAASEAKEYTVIAPFRTPIDFFGQYVIRTKEGFKPATVLSAVDAALTRANPNRISSGSETFAQMREDYFASDRSMAWLLSIVSVILLCVTAFGIVGIASFWVQQRTKQIGIRRALGATRTDIVRYFQTENFLIVSGGIVLGLILAFGLNQLLMAKYEMPRLPWIYLPMGAVALWIIGQLAVLAPALRAANVAPTTATRTV